MPQFVYQIRPTRADMLRTGPTADEAEIIGRHFEYLRGLCESGVVKLAGRTLVEDESGFGIVIYEATDLTAARAIMNADPAIIEGVMRGECFPFRVALPAS